MKKLLLLIAIVSITSPLFAYTVDDLENASFLANLGIITERDDPFAYRLDDTITRQEAVGIALKLGAYETPADYVCRGYYKDAKFAQSHRDAWVCASAELAADNGIISRERTTFRPKSNITKAESLAMLMKSADLTYERDVTVGFTGDHIEALYNPKTPQWQIDLLEGAHSAGIIDLTENAPDPMAYLRLPDASFEPNKPATRAQVFEFAAKILNNNGYELQGNTVEKSNGYTQYTSFEEDYSVSFLSDMIIRAENQDIISVQIVSPDFTPEEGGTILGVIKVVCGNGCLYEDLYRGFKDELLAEEGITITKENTGKMGETNSSLLEYTQDVEGVLLRGYIQVLYVNNTLYAVMALTDDPHFIENQRELQKFLKSLTIY